MGGTKGGRGGTRHRHGTCGGVVLGVVLRVVLGVYKWSP